MIKLRVLFFLIFLAHTLFTQDLYDINRIPEIRIEFAASDWAAKLDKLKRDGEKERMSATVTIDGQRFEKVGVRYKGNSSYFNTQKAGSSKLPFNMKADAHIEGQTFPGGYRTLKIIKYFPRSEFCSRSIDL